MRYAKIKNILTKTICILLIPVLIVGIIPNPTIDDAGAYTYADVDELQRQIDELRAKEDQLAKKASSIAAETASFEREKKNLENEIALLNNAIQLLEVQIQVLNGEIAVNEKKISNTQIAISETMVNMYINQDISLIERLASSKSFSSFVDNSTKLSSGTDGLTTSVETIKELKEELESKRNEVKAMQDSQAAQKKEMESRTAELQRAINSNEAERKQFVADKDAAYKERLRLSTRQSEIMWELAKDSIGSGISTNKGGYPYQGDCPKKQDAYFDQWGMYVCECVSYGAWKVYQRYGIKVKSIGRSGSYNGEYWPARLSGIVPMGSTPKAGSIASWSGGDYGHVAWVEYVDSSGNVWVSEYNVVRGEYSERNASKSGGWLNASKATYIYFDQYRK